MTVIDEKLSVSLKIISGLIFGILSFQNKTQDFVIYDSTVVAMIIQSLVLEFRLLD
jgi:hypothetical protein